MYCNRFGLVGVFMLVSVPPDSWSSAVRPQQHRAASPAQRSPPSEPGHRHPVYVKTGTPGDGPNHVLVHVTREWLPFHAEQPEAIDLDKHRHPIDNDEEE